MVWRSDAERWCARVAEPYRGPRSGAIAAFATRADIVFEFYDGLRSASSCPPDPDTLFEIGSITKVFTAILLAKLALDGRIEIDAPIADILPEFSKAPAWISPRSLSTHTSGLPRLPFNMLDRRAWCFYFSESRFNPYPKFSETDLVAWMCEYQPDQSPRARKFRYSNLGVALLGHILGRVAGGTYEEALKREVLDPIGLKDTRVTLNEDQGSRFAAPRRGNGAAAPLWDFEGLAGAGALRSTARDLVQFGRAVILAVNGEGPLSAPIKKTLEVQIAGRRSFEPGVCLGWSALPKMVSEKAIYNHDGGTFGSMATFFVCPEAGFVILALANRGPTLTTPIKQILSDPAGSMREMVAAFVGSTG